MVRIHSTGKIKGEKSRVNVYIPNYFCHVQVGRYEVTKVSKQSTPVAFFSFIKALKNNVRKQKCVYIIERTLNGSFWLDCVHCISVYEHYFPSLFHPKKSYGLCFFCRGDALHLN